MDYALIDPSTGHVAEIRTFSEALLSDQIKHGPDGLPLLRPLIEVGRDGYDPARHALDGPVYEIGTDQVVARYTTTDKPLPPIKAAAKAAVDAAAEAARGAWITPGAGQAMVYTQKAAEARDLVAGGTGPWPHLEAEVGITAKPDGTATATVTEVAQVVLAMEDAWLAVSAKIEAKRLAAKRDITAAADAATVNAVLAALVWPVPGK